MPRLIVYGRSGYCPDMMRWRRWVSKHPLACMEFDIDSDDEAYEKVMRWTGHKSVPTLVVAPDDGVDPIDEPEPLPAGRSPRGVDRGTMLTEPHPGQVEAFLERHGIPYGHLEEPAIERAGRHAEGLGGMLRKFFG